MLETEKKTLEEKGEVFLRIRAVPKSAHPGVGERLEDDSIKVRVKAAPEHGQANREIAEILAQEFGVYGKNVILLSGGNNRIKLFKVTNASHG